MNGGYNPDFNPTGIEGGVDTNALPWIELPQYEGLSIKPLRASTESGHFSMILKIAAEVQIENLLHLGSADLMMLSGAMRYTRGDIVEGLVPGIWGYIPANARIGALIADEDTELLLNSFGPLAFLNDAGGVRSVLTSADVRQLAAACDITLVPNTLAECMQPRPADSVSGSGVPLTIASTDARQLVQAQNPSVATIVNPHFVDTRRVEWIVNPDLPDIALKILRVSEETGTTSLIVRHNGVAGPHYHLGAADFLVLGGRIGYRAGPPDGYGAGVWFFEPAGARHEATQRIGDEDLIYTANVYGPIQFDEGPDTPIVAVQSWMQYKMLADASGARLVHNTFPNDESLLAWSPIGEL